MIATIINAIAFLVLFLSYYLRNRQINSSFIVLCLYAVVACFGVSYYNVSYLSNRVEFWPYCYFFLVACISFHPIIKADKRISTCNIINRIKVPSGLNLIVMLYVLCALTSLYNTWTNIFSKILSGDWQSVKVDAYNGLSDDVGTIGAYASAFVIYFRFLIFPYCFYCFTRKDKKFWIYISVILICILSTLFHYLLIAYRGGLLSIMIMCFISYVFFVNQIPNHRRKRLGIIGGVIIIGITAIAMSITASRFGETESGSEGSIARYIGQPMVNFNGGVATSATSYMGGKYFFMGHWKLDKADFWVDSKYHVETNDGSDFDTLIGCFYLDFGPITTAIIFILVSLIMRKLLSRESYKWSTIYVLFFYMDLIVGGAFHGPSSLSLQVVNMIIIYVILLFIEKKKSVHYENKYCSMLSQAK